MVHEAALYGSDIHVNVSERCFILKVHCDSVLLYDLILYDPVQCSEDQTSADQGSLRQGKLKYNASSGQIGELEKKFRAKS